MHRALYYQNGRPYRKLRLDEIIEKDAMQSWDQGELQPITKANGSTIGSTPSAFSTKRDFYNLVKPPKKGYIQAKPVCNRCLDYREPWHTDKFTCPECGKRWVLSAGGPGRYWLTEKEIQQQQQFVMNLIKTTK